MTSMSTTSSPAIGKLGQALSFDGVNDYVNVTDSASNSITSSITVSAWVKGSSQDNKIVVSKYTTTGNQRSWLLGTSNSTWGYGTNKLGVIISADGTIGVGTSKAYASTNVVFDNTWHHVAFTFTSNTLALYVDGVVETAQKNVDGTVNSLFDANSALTIGSIGNPLLYFAGLTDDVRVYNRALTTTEITQLYKLGQDKVNSSQNKTGGSLDTGLVGLWSFNGPDINWGANTAYDRSGQGNNGTITSMSTTSSPAIGKLGQALKFDGVDDWINIPDTSYGYVNLTMSAWIKTTNASNWVIGNGENSDLRISGGKIFFNYYTGVFQNLTGNTSVNDGRWHHIVVIREGLLNTVYLDGVSDGTLVTTGTPSSIGFDAIGSRDNTFSSTQTVTGSIDEVRIYNRALSASEVKQLYNLGR